MNKFSDKLTVFIKTRSRKVLHSQILEYVTRAEKNGDLAGLDLPIEKIAEYLVMLILGEDIRPKEKPRAAQLTRLISNTVSSTPKKE